MIIVENPNSKEVCKMMVHIMPYLNLFSRNLNIYIEYIYYNIHKTFHIFFLIESSTLIILHTLNIKFLKSIFPKKINE